MDLAEPRGAEASQEVIIPPLPPVQIEVETITEKPVIVTTQKNTAGTGRVFNLNKPPAIRGYKWSQKGVGFDCRKVTKNGDVYIAHLGKKKLSDFRSQSADREELRELVRNWILEKESEKGK